MSGTRSWHERLYRLVEDAYDVDTSSLNVTVVAGGGTGGNGGTGGGTVGTQDVNVVNVDPIEVSLQPGQFQTDALTDAELRAAPVIVDTGLVQPTTPSDTQPVEVQNVSIAVTGPLTDSELRAAPVDVSLPAGQFQTDALTDAQLRASPVTVDTGIAQPTTPSDTQPVDVQNASLTVTGPLTDAELRASPVQTQDDYALGEVLDDQTGNGTVLTFTFSQPVVSFWVAVTGDEQVVKIDHYGGTPSPSRGIPVAAGGVLPIPEPATTVLIYAPLSAIVTVWGQRRA